MGLGAQNTISSGDLVEELFSTLSYDELIPLVSWFSQDGRIAYKVLGLIHFDRFGDKIRTDMADRFATFYEAEKYALRAEYRAILDEHSQIESGASEVAITAVENAVEETFKRWAKLDDSIRSTFMSVWPGGARKERVS